MINCGAERQSCQLFEPDPDRAGGGNGMVEIDIHIIGSLQIPFHMEWLV